MRSLLFRCLSGPNRPWKCNSKNTAYCWPSQAAVASEAPAGGGIQRHAVRVPARKRARANTALPGADGSAGADHKVDAEVSQPASMPAQEAEKSVQQHPWAQALCTRDTTASKSKKMQWVYNHSIMLLSLPMELHR